jgi:hypothetical protein
MPLTEHPAPEQDAKGRFVRGNRGGPGNPFGPRVAELRGAFLDALTPQDMRDIALALVLKARSGDLTAAKLLLQYTLGKPIAIAPSGRGQGDEVPQPADSAADLVGALLANMPTAELASVLDGVSSPPKPMTKAERKAMYREMRRQRREKSPSAIGSNGSPAPTTAAG